MSVRRAAARYGTATDVIRGDLASSDWSSTRVRARLPADIGPGTYWLAVYRNGVLSSNRLFHCCMGGQRDHNYRAGSCGRAVSRCRAGRGRAGLQWPLSHQAVRRTVRTRCGLCGERLRGVCTVE